MEGWERIQYVMEREGMNKNSFSAAIGINNNVTITRIINEKRNPSRATCQKIADRFPHYSFEWLYSGEGDMLAEARPRTNPILTNNAHPVQNIGFMDVPLIHVRAQCGYLSGYGDLDYVDTLPTLPVIVDRTYHGKYRLFEAEGDSMDDNTRNAICDGDIVLGREVQRHLWTSRLHIDDWYFIIVHRTDGISIKKIIDHDVEHGIITCHPLNDLFKDYRVWLDEVAELYNVIKIVDRSTRL